jgi:flagellar hook-associated protein 2
VTSSVDGLVSGLSTSSLISQLMQVEAAPQDRLKAKVTTAETAVSSYQSVNAKVSAFKTAADTLGQLSTWRGIKAASTSPTVTATAVTGTNTAAGTTTFDVKALAKSQITTARVSPTAEVTSAGSITVTIGPADVVDPDTGVVTTDNSSRRTDHVVTLTDKTAKGVADALNAKGIGVKATVVSTGAAENILQFSGTRTGVDNAFTISNFDPPTTDVAAAQNALLKIGGGEEAGGYNVVSPTNTFTGLLTGVTVTVSKLEDGVTVEATSDVSGIADKFQALVDAANAALSEIKTQTAYNPSTNKGSPLTGDFSVRNMTQVILSSISQGLTYADPASTEQAPLPDIKFGSLSQMGIQLDSTGKLTFDKAKFTASYAANPSYYQQSGIAFANATEKLADTQTVSLSSVITGRKSEIDNYNNQISNWDVRLAGKRVALQKHYADLEVSLGKLKNQSNWLAGQLGGIS